MGVEVALAIGLTGLTATATGAAINAVVGFGLSYAAQRIGSRDKGLTSAAGIDTARGARIGLDVAADAPRAVILGETAVGGSLVYWHLTGTDNKRLAMVIALADHQCEALTGVIVNGKRRAWDDTTGFVAGTNEKLRVKFKAGTAGQAADAELVAGSGGAWTANHRGAGVCYAVVFVDYDEKQWPGGIPQLAFVVQGFNKLLDPRVGTRGFTTNWGIIVYNVLLGIKQHGATGPHLLGLHAPAASVRADDAIAAINASGEAVGLSAGGSEPRYRVGAVVRSDMTTRQVLELLLPAGAGEIVESAGIYRIIAGVAQTPVATLTDDDILPDQPFTYAPKLPRSELVNTVEATYLDPTRAWVPSPLPVRASSEDVAADGGVRLVLSLDLSACRSRTQAQRVMEIARRRARRQGRAAFSVRARWGVLEPGDWVAVTSARRGWVSRTFEVMRAEQQPGGSVDLSLAEADAGLDDWSVGLEIDDNEALDLPSGEPGSTVITVTGLYPFVFEASETVSRPGLRIDWTPITDGAVVQLALEYRKVGDTVALQGVVLEPAAGSYSFVNGVQGGVTYEARLRAITQPDTGSDWTPWVAAATSAAAQIVSAAAVDLLPDTVTAPKLSAQVRFELGLATAREEVIGSLAEVSDFLIAALETASALQVEARLDLRDTTTSVQSLEQVVTTANYSFAQQITTLQAQFDTSIGEALALIVSEATARADADAATAATLDALYATVTTDVAAAIENEATVRASETSALATAQTVLTTRVGDAESSVIDVAESVDGIHARRTIAVDANGIITGAILLDGTAAGANLDFLASVFRVSDPNVGGGAPVPLFAVQLVEGAARLVLNGELIADAIRAGSVSVASLTALSSNFANMTCSGFQRSADGKMVIDWNTARFWIDS